MCLALAARLCFVALAGLPDMISRGEAAYLKFGGFDFSAHVKARVIVRSLLESKLIGPHPRREPPPYHLQHLVFRSPFPYYSPLIASLPTFDLHSSS